jgi:hypothetical protein
LLSSLTEDDILFDVDRDQAEKTLRHHQGHIGKGASGLHLFRRSTKVNGVTLSLCNQGKLSHWIFKNVGTPDQIQYASPKGRLIGGLIDVIREYRATKHELPCKTIRLIIPSTNTGTSTSSGLYV